MMESANDPEDDMQECGFEITHPAGWSAFVWAFKAEQL
jgi:hypothetical protein